jgi:hypothetical protein
MERDALLQANAKHILADRLFDNADTFTIPFCRTCNTIAVLNQKSGIASCGLCCYRYRAWQNTPLPDRDRDIKPPPADVTMLNTVYITVLLTYTMQMLGIHMKLTVKELYEKVNSTTNTNHSPIRVSTLELLRQLCASGFADKLVVKP